jgi:hypothetical protein
VLFERMGCVRKSARVEKLMRAKTRHLKAAAEK